MVNYSMSQEEREKCIVEEIMEILPYNSAATVNLLLQVLEAIPREVTILIDIIHVINFFFN